jgi:hypothetical protein
VLSTLLGIARKIRRSAAFKDTVAAPKRFAVARAQRANKGIFSVEIEAHSGFFAVMQSILFILQYCDENNLYPDIVAKGGIYGEESRTIDWFGRLFDSVHRPPREIADRLAKRSDIRTSRIKGVEDLGFRSKYEMQLSLAAAAALFKKYFRPAPAVIADVDSLCELLAVSAATLAVHYRGTDKVHEIGAVPWPMMRDAVEKVSNMNPGLTRILLASDDRGFIEFFQNSSLKIPVTVAPAVYMPKGATPIHFSGHPGLEIGREALVTCLLLSRCGFLVKTSSYLSAWSKIINPSLPTWLIAPPLSNASHFPDRALWLDQKQGKVDFDQELA